MSHHHRKLFTAGCIVGTVALLLLVHLAMQAFGTEAEPLTARFVLLTGVDLILGVTSLRLLGDACAGARIERRTSSHVEGVHETVDRLASVLKDSRR